MSAAVEQMKTAEPQDVDLRKSYVAGGGFWLGGPGVIPSSADVITGRYGADVYEHMMRDPDVWAAVVLLKILVLADGIQIEPCLSAPKKGQPDYEQAQAAYEDARRNADFLNRCVKGMSTPLRTVFEEMLDALVHGNKVAEITLRDGADEDAGQLVLDSIKVKPHSAISFVVDFFWNLLGFMPTWRAQGDRREVLPREKFFVLALHTKDSDPRGQSSLTPAHDGWSFKQKLWPIYLRWLRLCAVPSLIGTTAPNAKDKIKVDSNRNPIIDSSGKPVVISPQDELLEAMLDFENGSAIAVPNGANVVPVEVQGKGEQFERGFTLSGKQITRAILLQELATLDAQHQTKGSTGEQSNFVEAEVAMLRGKLTDAFRMDVAEMLLLVNFGQAALEYMPHVSLGDSSRKDWAKDGDVVVKLIEATMMDEDGTVIPALTPSQVQALASMIGLPPPTDDEIEARRAAREQRQKQQSGQPQDQAPPAKQNDKQGDQRRAA